jgi:DNA-binding MarR family transcriptional regulator/YHS domain-containing protein
MQDPVCGMEISPAQAAATSLYKDQTYYFCARTCKQRFDQEPERYLHATERLPQYARTLYEALETLSKAFYGAETQAEGSRDLTEAEWDALRLLGRQGECMMRELASGCNVALSTMTGIIDRLLKKKLVQRRHSQEDRRVVLIRLTGRGKLVYEERLDADMRLVLTMLQALQPGEQEQLVSLVQKIVGSLSPLQHDMTLQAALCGSERRI